jgi:hypothetical protein
MANIRLDMTMSLDGFIAGPQDDADAPMGIGGFRLFNWLDHRNEPGPHGEVYAAAWRRARSSPVAGPTSWPAGGRAITTTACRYSCSPTTSQTSRRQAASAT